MPSTAAVSVPVDSTFDPYNQTFVITAQDGITSVPATLTDILTLNRLIASQGIVFGVQAGITMLLFLIMMLMTKRDKRQSAVFLLNVTALLLIFVCNVLWCVSLDGIFYNFYNWELYYYPPGHDLTQAMQISASIEILSILIDFVIYCSLVLQIRIVCCTLPRLYKRCVMAISFAVALGALTVRFVLGVYNCNWNIFGLLSITREEFEFLGQLARASNACTVFAIAFFSVIFVTKLAFAIRLRRRLNMKQFGPMQIIFVMGCQTMIVPMIFAILGNSRTALGHQIQSFVPTIVAVFLPLSGMWASTQTNSSKLIRSDSRFRRAIPVGATDLSSAKAYGSGKAVSDGTDTLVEDDEDDGLDTTHGHYACSTSPDGGKMTIRSKSRSQGQGQHAGDGKSNFGEDLEMQAFGKNEVVVDRTYSVRSD
ncbi:hypothetical protein LTR62_002654 [Meristemomyces frigidus]|uniref:Pheromone alpha factor receptor n=1 Tax=Meristemomyces frigidus TaxID=1508187 RepID=A0AAN7TQJ5_9PEZI|nr:hypothetical protein LTR62_002654 [Meristemomyces frigidus]